MALEGVATGKEKAQEQAKQAGSISAKGCRLECTAVTASIGMRTLAVALDDANSVKIATDENATNTTRNRGTEVESPVPMAAAT
mmetsp:Transcript_22115/g.26078  ORF Transcript_22115/g.26078 Transcript_22115/m.26078 type:complete len:84 (-) Transcript_22115:1406-1657(-)